jgi:hypothetical protein
MEKLFLIIISSLNLTTNKYDFYTYIVEAESEDDAILKLLNEYEHDDSDSITINELKNSNLYIKVPGEGILKLD